MYLLLINSKPRNIVRAIVEKLFLILSKPKLTINVVSAFWTYQKTRWKGGSGGLTWLSNLRIYTPHYDKALPSKKIAEDVFGMSHLKLSSTDSEVW